MVEPFGKGGYFFQREGRGSSVAVFPAVDGGESDTEFGGEFLLSESEFLPQGADQFADFGLGDGCHG